MSFNAFAESENSQPFWQPKSQQHALIPELSYTHSKFKSKLTNQEHRPNSRQLSLEYAYGITENFALGAEVDYVNNNYSTYTVDGLGDIMFLGRGFTQFGSGKFLYGGGLSVSPGDGKEKSTNKYNAYSGGHMLTPYIGYEMTHANLKAGAAVSYDIRLGDAKEKYADGSTGKFSGAESLTIILFLESAINDKLTLGGQLGHMSTSDYKDETTGQTSKQSDVVNLTGYATSKIQENIDLIGRLSLSSIEDSNTRKDQSATSITIGARFKY